MDRHFQRQVGGDSLAMVVRNNESKILVDIRKLLSAVFGHLFRNTHIQQLLSTSSGLAGNKRKHAYNKIE